MFNPADWPVTFYDKKNNLLKYCPNQKGFFTVGKFGQDVFEWKTNNDGWLSSIDYIPFKTHKRIAIIGDSFVASLQSEGQFTIAENLRKKIPNSDIYSFGISGSPLSNYLSIAKYSINVYKPDILVFLVVPNDYDESFYRDDQSIKGFTYFNNKGEIIPTEKNYMNENIIFLRKYFKLLYPLNDFKRRLPLLIKKNAKTQYTMSRQNKLIISKALQKILDIYPNSIIVFSSYLDCDLGYQEQNILHKEFFHIMRDKKNNSKRVYEIFSFFENHKNYFSRDGHWNNDGNYAAASKISEFLQQTY